MFTEPSIKWKDSKAKKMLYSDICEGRIPSCAKDQYGKQSIPLTKDIYQMHDEYKLYDPNKFSARLSSLRATYEKLSARNMLDEEAFEKFLHNHPATMSSHKGYPDWQGSEAQKLLRDDINAGKHKLMRPYDLYKTHKDYYENFPLAAFRDKLYQEIRTAKYLHTCKVKGKLHVAS